MGVGEYGADVNRRDRAGKTPLWYAREGDEGVGREIEYLDDVGYVRYTVGII